MIEMIDGPVGCGKSLVTMWLMANRWLPEGLQIGTNLAVARDGLHEYARGQCGYDFDDRQIITYNDKDLEQACVTSPEGCKLVIDEASLPFDASDTKTANRKTREFFALSRHYHQDVFFIAQSSENLDIRLRRMANHYYHVQDLREWPLPLIGIRLRLPVAYVTKWNKTHTVELETFMVGHNKRLYATYDTYAKHGTSYCKPVMEFQKPALVKVPLWRRLLRAEPTPSAIKKAVMGEL